LPARDGGPVLAYFPDMARDFDVVSALALTAIVAVSGIWRLIG
jgi:hypothetical protein